MTLRQTIIDDASTVFTSTNDFAECLVYRPLQGTARKIDAVVIRQLAEVISDDENRTLQVFEVHVTNSACLGISAKEINTGGDTIDIADRVGKSPKPRAIVQIIDQDEGMLVIQCR